jgi:hypothetical protein
VVAEVEEELLEEVPEPIGLLLAAALVGVEEELERLEMLVEEPTEILELLMDLLLRPVKVLLE